MELYQQATKDFDAGNYASACPKLEEAVKLAPYGVGGRLTLARCHERLGKLGSAYTNYVLAEGLAKSAKNTKLKKEAEKGAKAIEPKLAKLTVSVSEAIRGLKGLEITRDGVPIGEAQWGQPIPVDKGSHVITATAAGKRSWEKTVAVDADGQSVAVALDALEDIPPPPPIVVTPPPEPVAPPPPIVVAPSPLVVEPKKPAPPLLSHRGQFGAVLRADINGLGKGILAAPGLSYGVGDYVDATVAGLLGRDKGVEPGATVLFLQGKWKPRASVGVPIFFVDGARPGVRLAAGVQWDPIRYFGVFIDAAIAVFPNAPVIAGVGDKIEYQNVVFVPSVGIQPRL